MTLRGHRWYLLSWACVVAGFVLVWFGKDVGSFAVIASVALAGGHATNVAERRYRQEGFD